MRGRAALLALALGASGGGAALAGSWVAGYDESLPAVTAVPPAAHPAPQPSQLWVPDPLLGGSIARARTRLQVFDRPGGHQVSALAVTTSLAGPTVLLVSGQAPGWVQVRLPVRPNTARGWVRTSQVTLSRDDWSIEVSRARHVLTVRHSGRPTAEYPVAVGAPRTPTPTGVFFVTDLLLTGNPHGAYGPAALGLSGHSDVLLTFAGADGVLGIHGTNEPGSIGRSVSHGCIRMRNPDALTLFHTVPLGTPVVVI